MKSGDIVFFLAREGQFLKKCFDYYLSIHNSKNVHTYYLRISRLSVFLATVNIIEMDSHSFKKELVSNYELPIKNGIEFFHILGFNESEISFLCKKYNIHNEECEFIKSKQFEILWNDNDFKELLLQIQKEAQIKLYKEFDGIDTIVLSDVGWHGTMQSYLHKIFDKKKIIGYYMGTFHPKYSEDKNNIIKGLIFDYFDDRYYLRHYKDLLILEPLLRANHGQITNHRNNFCLNDQGLITYHEYSKSRQLVMYEIFKKISNYNQTYPIDVSQLLYLSKNIIDKKPIKTKSLDYYYSTYQAYGIKQRKKVKLLKRIYHLFFK